MVDKMIQKIDIEKFGVFTNYKYGMIALKII